MVLVKIYSEAAAVVLLILINENLKVSTVE